jgi:hypothetical protein
MSVPELRIVPNPAHIADALPFLNVAIDAFVKAVDVDLGGDMADKRRDELADMRNTLVFARRRLERVVR